MTVAALQTSASQLADFLDRSHRLVVLTGAGCSTQSGIPDYRDRDGAWKHHKPMTFQDFTGTRSARRRYWARSAVGWQRVANAQPNASHRALAQLDSTGRLDRVECLDCRTGYRRQPFQDALRRQNPHWRHWNPTASLTRPDGDALSRRRLLPHGLVRLPLRQRGPQPRPAAGDPQPGEDPGRRRGDVEAGVELWRVAASGAEGVGKLRWVSSLRV